MGEPRKCDIPARALPPCDLGWGHDGDMHANNGDGFFARDYVDEHRRRQDELRRAAPATRTEKRKAPKRDDGLLAAEALVRFAGDSGIAQWEDPNGVSISTIMNRGLRAARRVVARARKAAEHKQAVR